MEKYNRYTRSRQKPDSTWEYEYSAAGISYDPKHTIEQIRKVLSRQLPSNRLSVSVSRSYQYRRKIKKITIVALRPKGKILNYVG
jgi:hypothetical protein